MVWKAEDPQGNEAAKVRFDVLPYTMGSLLDIGCGPVKLWPHAVGVDSMIDTQLFGIPMKPDLVVPDATRMPIFGSGAFDTVFSSHTLEHIADHRAALAEWWRLVRPGGYLVLYLPHKAFYPNIGQPGANPDHKHDFLPDDIVQAMADVAVNSAQGWDLLEHDERNQGREYSFLLVFRKREDAQRVWAVAPRPEKSAGIVRLGGHGDALWAASVAAYLKDEGFHVTVYTSKNGGEVLRHDPHIDRLIVLRNNVLTDDELLRYYAHEAVKHDRWVNLVGSVETNLLPHPSEVRFFLPHQLRHKLMNRNYLDTVHEWAGLVDDGQEPLITRQKFYPTEAERAAAVKLREALAGPVVVVNPAGSGPVKYWPHTQRLMELLAARGVHTVALGDIRDPNLVGVEGFGHVVAMDFPLRLALAYAQLADAVVATESVIANAVAMEPMLKVVTLSHSSVENLTRDWLHTVSIEPQGLACHPCHRVHGADFSFCARDRNTGAAACQAMATAEIVADVVLQYLEGTGKLEPMKEAA
jgi:ADP-heptose:LPS heptosyltransferase/predicted SAM-dependent methyltransferase